MNEKIIASTSVPALDSAYVLEKCQCAKRPSAVSILLGIIIIIVSIVLIIIPQEGIVTDKNFTSAFYMFGLLGSLYGIYYLASKSRQLTYQPTGSKVAYRQLYFSLDEADQVKDFVSGKTASLPKASTQGGVRLRAYVAQDGSMATVQVSRYHELTYELQGAPVILTGESAKALAEYIKSNK